MKKKLIAMISILLLIAVSGIGIFFGIRNNSNMMLQELYLNKWNDAYARYLVCRANVIGEPWVSYRECLLSFDSKSEKPDIVKTNKKDYIEEITYHDGSIVRQASLFYTDNNYYVLFYDEQNEFYTIQNCYMIYFIDGTELHVPSPVPIEISYEMFDVYHQIDVNCLDYLYDNYTFEDAVEFYGRISEEYVSIDEEKQQITLDGYRLRKKGIIEKCMTLDFKDRTVIVSRENGSKTVLDGTETLEDLE